MLISINALKACPVARFWSKTSHVFTVTLTSGKELLFEKDNNCGSCFYEGTLTEAEEKEYLEAMMLVGF